MVIFREYMLHKIHNFFFSFRLLRLHYSPVRTFFSLMYFSQSALFLTWYTAQLNYKVVTGKC